MEIKLTIQIPDWKKEFFKTRKEAIKRADFFFTGKTKWEQRMEHFKKLRKQKEEEKVKKLISYNPTLKIFNNLLLRLASFFFISAFIYGLYLYFAKDSANWIPENIRYNIFFFLFGTSYFLMAANSLIFYLIPIFFIRKYPKRIRNFLSNKFKIAKDKLRRSLQI